MAAAAATVTAKLTVAANSPSSTTRAPQLALVRSHPHRSFPLSFSLRHKLISSSAALSISVLLLSSSHKFAGGAQRQPATGVAMASTDAAASIPKIQKSDEEWRTILSPEQFRILRKKGTEFAGTGEYNKFKKDGLYECAACGTPLYKSTTKFDSGCGWPAFYEGLPGAITETADPDGRRVEITCTACGGHLGHNFRGEGFSTPTNERHCVNSISLKFTPGNK